VDYYGIWDDVTLLAHPAVYIKDVFIKPSVRNRELVVEYTLANESSRDANVQLRAVVQDKNTNVLDLPTHRVSIVAGQAAKATVRQSWPGLRLWSHKDPYLYHLESALSTGDMKRTRFGFREFWIEGHEFFLNRRKIHLLATTSDGFFIAQICPGYVRRSAKRTRTNGCAKSTINEEHSGSGE